MPIVQRFDAKPVPRKYQETTLSVPQRISKHPAQFLHECCAFLLVEVDQYLRIRFRCKSMSLLYQAMPEFTVPASLLTG